MLKRFLNPSAQQGAKPSGRSTERRPYCLDGQDVTLAITRNAQARRFTLRLDPREAALKVTVPPHADDHDILAFVRKHHGWAQEKLAKQPILGALRPGVKIPIRGVAHRLEHTGQMRGLPAQFMDGDEAVLALSGDVAFLPRRTAEFLKREAKADIEPKALALAGTINKRVKSIAFKDTKTRWGSCTSDGALSFSWRIMMAPPVVIDYLIAHEVAHLREMNHGPKFWALCEELCPETKRAKAWLKKNGSALQAIPFS